MTDMLNERPRRRVIMLAKFQADDWKTLSADLKHLAWQIDRSGGFSSSSVSGGYSSGHIIVTSEDGSIDHDSWAKELNEYLDNLPEVKAPAAKGEG